MLRAFVKKVKEYVSINFTWAVRAESLSAAAWAEALAPSV
jgi:hypothetical protein